MSKHNPPSFGQWQPIETAPKDGRYVIISDGITLCDIGMWRNSEPERVSRGVIIKHAMPEGWFNVGRCRVLHPAHWMPLPAPPPTPEAQR